MSYYKYLKVHSVMTRLNFPTTNIDATSTYTQNDVTYQYDPSVNSWTSFTPIVITPIPGFPPDIPGVIPNAKGGKYVCSGCIEISLDNNNWKREIETSTVVNIYVRWHTSCLDEAHHTKIEGVVTYEFNDVVLEESTGSYILQRIPNNTSSDTNLTTAEVNSITKSKLYAPNGFGNAGETTLVYGTTDSTDVTLDISTNNGPIPLPTSIGAAEPIKKGAIISVSHKNSGSVSTATTTTLNFTDSYNEDVTKFTYTTETSGSLPSIKTPQIESPTPANDLSPDITLESDVYVPVNHSETHASSDWEVYEADLAANKTDVITSSQDSIHYGATGESILTLGTDINISLMSRDDSLEMYDENGDVGSYTPTTNEIIDQKEITGYKFKNYNYSGNWDQYKNIPFYKMGWNGKWGFAGPTSLDFGIELSSKVTYSHGWLVKSEIAVPLVVNRDGVPWNNGGGAIFIWSSESGNDNTYQFVDAFHRTTNTSSKWTYTTETSSKYWLLLLKVSIGASSANESFGKSLTPSNVTRFETKNGWTFYSGINGYTVLQFDAPNPDLKFFQLEDEVQPGVYVVQVDVANNLMETTLGTFENRDGGGRVGGDKQVTTLVPKSGSGDFSTVLSDLAVEVKSSNGEWISNDNSNEGADFTGASAQSFFIGNNDDLILPGAPNSEPPDSLIYTEVVNVTGDTTNLTTYDLTSTELNETKAYYSRVKYNSASYESSKSDYHEFSTSDTF